METTVAIIAIIVDETQSAAKINSLLHDFENLIIGRMGLPYRSRGMNIISVVMDAPLDQINNLAGQLGRIPGVTAKAITANR